MPNENPTNALRPALSAGALLATAVTLAGCIGDAFQVGNGGGGGSGAADGGAAGGEVGGGGSASGPPIPLLWPDSQTVLCSNGVSFLDTCPEPDNSFYGQDGNYELRPPAYEERDGTVTDSVTGLVWEKATMPTAFFNQSGARQHCESWAADQIAGFNDWRLPTRRELVSILDMGRAQIVPAAFSAYDGFYWSSTSVKDDKDYFWGVWNNRTEVGFLDAMVSTNGRALCVHGTSPRGAQQLEVAGPVVVDNSTGLIWELQAALGRKNWRDALVHCDTLKTGGKEDWRLPSAKELLTLVDDAQSGPSINPEVFPGVDPTQFWSSTPDPNDASKAFQVEFSNGAAQTEAVREVRLARCVRSDPQ